MIGHLASVGVAVWSPLGVSCSIDLWALVKAGYLLDSSRQKGVGALGKKKWSIKHWYWIGIQDQQFGTEIAGSSPHSGSCEVLSQLENIIVDSQ